MMKIERLRIVGSTNEYIKKYIGSGGDIAVFADVQTGGKGTKGRSFLSDMGGVYLSVLTFYSDMPPANSFRIMTHAAVSVCRTAEEFGIAPEIKWQTDTAACELFRRTADKKLAGILIENGIVGGKIAYSIVGIGLNVSNDVSSLGGIAVSMSSLLSSPPAVEDVRVSLLNHYQRPSTFEEYLSFVRFLGEKIDVSEGEERYIATASRILPDGRLEVIKDGKAHILTSAEITLFPVEKR